MRKGDGLMPTSDAPAARAPRRALIVLTRAPLPGRTKTRMMPALAPEQCAALHAAFLADLGAICRDAARLSGARLVVRVTPDASSDAVRAAFGLADEYAGQAPGGLGERMDAAFAAAFRAGCAEAVLVGSDCPELAPADVLAAFDALASHDCVLGPTADGGYYLIGLRARCPQAFGIEGYGGASVLARTRARLVDAGLTCAFLPEHADMDTLADLRALAVRLAAGAADGRVSAAISCPATAQAIDALARAGVPLSVRGGGAR